LFLAQSQQRPAREVIFGKSILMLTRQRLKRTAEPREVCQFTANLLYKKEMTVSMFGRETISDQPMEIDEFRHPRDLS
jgi:hypothetical protein